MWVWRPASHTVPEQFKELVGKRGGTQLRTSAFMKTSLQEDRAAQRLFPEGTCDRQWEMEAHAVLLHPLPQSQPLLKRSQSHRSRREDHQRHKEGTTADPWGTKRQDHPDLSQRHRQGRRHSKTQRDPGVKKRGAKQMEWKRLRHREMREGEKCKGKAKRNERDENEGRTADSAEGHARQGVGMGLVPTPTVAEYTRVTDVTAPALQPAAPLAFVLRLEHVAMGRKRPLPPQ